jgi:purine catabolism regulator
MHLTVEQALTIHPFSEGKLIAGESGTSRIIKSVNVMDAPDITDWIKEGEMLFTTAFIIKDSPENAIQLLRKLDQRGSAGLGIKLGRFWSSVPEELLQEADHLGFPLIELPYHFTFSDQINGLFHDEMLRNTRALHTVLEKQKQLMRFALKPEPIRQLFQDISDVIGYPIAIIGSSGHALYNNTNFSEMQLTKGWPWKNHYQWVNAGVMHYYRVPLVEKEECIGFVIFFPPDAFLLKVEEGLFHQAAEMISFHMGFSYKDYVEHSLLKGFGSLLERYFDKTVSIDSVVDYAQRLELLIFKGAYQCVLAEVPSYADPNKRIKMIEEIRMEFKHNPAIQELKGVHVYLDDGLFSIYPAEPLQGESALPRILLSSINGLFNQSQELDTSLRLSVSNRKLDPELLSEALDECRETLKLAKQLEIKERVVQFETIEWAYIFQHVPIERMEKFCDKALVGLLSKDEIDSSVLLQTLEVFLDSDGQVNETAKRLFIHRNTVIYRIGKISGLLEMDLKKVNHLLKLKLVFLFRFVLKSERS